MLLYQFVMFLADDMIQSNPLLFDLIFDLPRQKGTVEAEDLNITNITDLDYLLYGAIIPSCLPLPAHCKSPLSQFCAAIALFVAAVVSMSVIGRYIAGANLPC
jgi:hypothetical protein